MEKLNTKLRILDGNLMCILALILAIFGQVIIMFLISLFVPDAKAFNDSIYADYIYAAYNSLVLAGSVFLYAKINRFSALGNAKVKGRLSAKQTAMLPLIAVLCVLAFMPLAQIFLLIMTSTGYQLPTPVRNDTVGILIANIFIFALLPAVCEEFLFRGNMAVAFRQKSYVFAIALSALLFGLFHLSAAQLVHQALLGAVMCYVFFISKSLWAAAGIHFFNNLLALLLDFFVKEGDVSTLGTGAYVGMMLGISVVFIFVLLAVLNLYTRITKQKEGVAEASQPRKNILLETAAVIGRAFTPQGIRKNTRALNQTMSLLYDPEAALVGQPPEMEQSEKDQKDETAEGNKEAKVPSTPSTQEEYMDLQRQYQLKQAKKRDRMSVILVIAILVVLWVFTLMERY